MICLNHSYSPSKLKENDIFFNFKVDSAKKVNNIIEKNICSFSNFMNRNSYSFSYNTLIKNHNSQHNIKFNRRLQKIEYSHYKDINGKNNIKTNFKKDKEKLIKDNFIIRKNFKRKTPPKILSSKDKKYVANLLSISNEKKLTNEDIDTLNKEKNNNIISNIRKNLIIENLNYFSPKTSSSIINNFTLENINSSTIKNLKENFKNQFTNSLKIEKINRRYYSNSDEKCKNSDIIDKPNEIEIVNKIPCKMINDGDIIIKWLKNLKIKDADKLQFFDDSDKDNLKYLKNPKKDCILKEIKKGY